MRSKYLQPGSLLVMTIALATIWLGATNQLPLYIHPRYITFSVVLCMFGLALSVLTIRQKPTSAERPSNLLTLGLFLFVFAAFLLFKPTVLSSRLANQRGVNASVSSASTPLVLPADTVQLFANNDYNQLSIKDWATLLKQINDPAFFAGKQATLTGFITADESDPQNTFFVSRFVVSCCAVDAQPIGVPVSLAKWQNHYRPDQWVKVRGSFGSNPSAGSSESTALHVKNIQATAQPKDPYVY